METPVIEELEKMFEKMKPPKQRGFVFLPGVEGFDVFEFDAGILKLAITFANNAEKLTTPNHKR